MPELEERAKRADELTGEPVDDRHMMSVIMGILDQDTLKHTVQYQGTKADRNLGMFKQKIMEFVNLTVPAKSDPIVIGHFEEKEDAEMYDEEFWAEDEAWMDNDNGNLNAMGEWTLRP